jgi:hypothetical protein
VAVVVSRWRDRSWLLLPQVFSRLSSVYVFALIARRTDADSLGALALATAFSAAPVALSAAIVGKPLAALSDRGRRLESARMAYSAAVLVGLALSSVLALIAWRTSGLVQVALLGGALGVPSAMVVESLYWRSLFLDGTRKASLTLSGAYAAQALLFTAGLSVLTGSAILLTPFAALAVVAVATAVAFRGFSLRGAWRWLTTLRTTWLPYVFGVAASLIFIQAVPSLLAATSGFAAASVYRAGELAFGATNLLIGVTVQALMTEGAGRPTRVHARATALLVGVAALNAVALVVVPEALLREVLGATAPALQQLVLFVAIQRAALAASNVGNVLLVPRISPRRFALIDIFAASWSLTFLIVGGVVDGLRGSLAGLALAEVLLALLYTRVLRKVS